MWIEGCAGNCFADVTIYLAITMIGRDLVTNTLVEVFWPNLKASLCKFFSKKEKSKNIGATFLERNFELQELGPRPLLPEYLELGILVIFE